MGDAAERVVRLRRRLDETIAAGHPWIYRDAIDGTLGSAGEIVTVLGAGARFLARGLADAGPIGVRVWTTVDRPLDGALMRERLEAARALRSAVLPADLTAYRLLHGEGDRVPGVVCDVYGAYAVLQLDGQGVEALLPEIFRALKPVLEQRGVRTLLRKRGRQGEREIDILWGPRPEATVEVSEYGMAMGVDLLHGQKTGLFVDHRESRRRVRALARDLRVLNLYGYTGGFSVAAGLGGARGVTTVDVAAPAVSQASENWVRNGLAAAQHRAVCADARAFLTEAAARSERYDLIVCDPPSFAPNERSVPKALDAYCALNAAALGLLEPGGLLLTASCSSHVPRELFRRALAAGAQRAGRLLQILEAWGAPADHPRLAAFAEGDYLQVVLCKANSGDDLRN